VERSTKRAVLLVVLAVVVLTAVSLVVVLKEEQKAIRFGCALSLSGAREQEGKLTREGYDLWKEHVNSQGGILIGNDRYIIDILYYDDESDPQKTALLVEKLIIEDNVDLLLGPYGSDYTFEAAAIAERYRVPMVEGGGASETIFAQGFKYTFGVISPAADYFKTLLEGAARLDPKPKRVAIVSAGDLFSVSAANGAQQHAELLGFDSASIITFENPDELTSLLGEVKEDKPNMVLFSAHFQEALVFVSAAKEVGLSPELFGVLIAPSDPAFITRLGKDAEYILGTAQWTPDSPYYGPVFGGAKDYTQLFRARYGKTPDYHAAAASACGVAFQLALEDAAAVNREKVREALASLDMMTFYGRIKFDERGMDIYNPMSVVQIQKGTTVTIWPEHFATGSIRYPTPSWEERASELKVAVLHFGHIGDYGWTYEAHVGAQAMAEALPYVNLSEREDAVGPNTTEVMRAYAEAGNKVIFCHSWEFGESIEEVAAEYPDVIFMWGGGIEKKAPNAGMYFGRMYEARFLTGMVAGAMTKTNMIGYAAAIPLPEVVRGINAFARGVAAVNPDARVYVEWIGEWYNPPEEKNVTISLIEQGCDVITHHSDSYAPGEAAEEKGVYYISYHSDMRRFAPHVFLTGAVWNWTPIMTDIMEAARNGTWDDYPEQDWWYGLAEGGVKLAPFGDAVPDAVRAKVEANEQALMRGEVEVFPGMTDEELRALYYLESNIVGELPPA
jgi:branched-chain amino acid transport system substrate-binding protein